MIVLELEEVGDLLPLVYDDWQDLSGIELLWAIEVDLSEQAAEGCDRL